MKEKLNWFLLGAFITSIAILLLNKCENREIKHIGKGAKKVDSIQKKVDTLKAEGKKDKKDVKTLKDKKGKIKYKTVFDTIPVYDTLHVNLIKCDSVNRIGDQIIAKQDTIIQKQDTIIQGQEEIISDLDSHNQVLESEVKKQKRKLIFTKILAGAIIVVTLLLAR